MADRYAYVPLIGIFIMVSWGAAEAFAVGKFPKLIIIFLAGTILFACAFRTRNQLGYWQNDLAVFGHTVAIDPNDMRMHLNFGIALEDAGRLGEAAKEYREAVHIAPNSAEARYNLGCVLVNLGQRDEAIRQFKEVLRLKPGLILAEKRLRALGVSPSR